MPSLCNGRGGPTIPASMTGASLAQRRRGWSPLERAAFAAAWIEGKVVVTELTAKAINGMVGANASYTGAMRKLPDETRAEVCQELRPLMREKPKPTQLELPLSVPAAINDDATLAALMVKVGVEHALEIAAAIEARA
jgi:hypothetical protein